MGTISVRPMGLRAWDFFCSWASAVVGVAAIRLGPDVADLGSAWKPWDSTSLASSEKLACLKGGGVNV